MADFSGAESGWNFDDINARLDVFYRGTRVALFDVNSFDSVLAIAATTTITAGTGATTTTGNNVNTAADERVTVGNLRLGAVSSFGMTEPTSAAVFKQGTAPVGAIDTSGGVFTNGTVMRKIIAAGTASNIQT